CEKHISLSHRENVHSLDLASVKRKKRARYASAYMREHVMVLCEINNQEAGCRNPLPKSAAEIRCRNPLPKSAAEIRCRNPLPKSAAEIRCQSAADSVLRPKTTSKFRCRQGRQAVSK